MFSAKYVDINRRTSHSISVYYELENAIYQKSYSLYFLNFPNFELNCLKDTDIMHLII